MIDWFNKLDIKLQIVIISSTTSIIVLLIGWLLKIIYERYSLNYKLKKEYEFEQKKKLKEEIAKNKVHLLNIVEEFNHRLWNFSKNISANWHKIPKYKWFETDQYYLNSFVYRFLVFLHWTLKTERDTISIDTTIADKNDILFLKYVKTFKDIFSDADLLSELNYSSQNNTNHFYKNDLIGYSKWVTENTWVLDFDNFCTKLKYSYEPLKEVIEYFSSIENEKTDKNLNVLRCFHLLAISFLNKFGHTYQKTNKKKIKVITDLYRDKILIKKCFQDFIIKSKLEDEIKGILNKIK